MYNYPSTEPKTNRTLRKTRLWTYAIAIPLLVINTVFIVNAKTDERAKAAEAAAELLQDTQTSWEHQQKVFHDLSIATNDAVLTTHQILKQTENEAIDDELTEKLIRGIEPAQKAVSSKTLPTPDTNSQEALDDALATVTAWNADMRSTATDLRVTLAYVKNDIYEIDLRAAHKERDAALFELQTAVNAVGATAPLELTTLLTEAQDLIATSAPKETSELTPVMVLVGAVKGDGLEVGFSRTGDPETLRELVNKTETLKAMRQQVSETSGDVL